MAKERSEYDISAGLSLGRRDESEETVVKGSADGTANAAKKVSVTEKPVEQPAVQPEPAVEKSQQAAAPNSFAELYASQANFAVEPRNVRIQIVVTQTTAAKLDKLVQERKIRSKNDLLNFLLEGYLATLSEHGQ